MEGRDHIREQYLMTVRDQGELAVVEGILRAENILYFTKAMRGQGYFAFLSAFSNLNIDVYVSSEDYERAREAVSILPE